MTPPEPLLRGGLFSHFTEPQLEMLERCVSPCHFPAGTSVLREGDQTVDAYVLDTGQVSIERRTPYGLYRLATINPGELFGETSFVDRDVRSGDAIALTHTDLLALSWDALHRTCERDQQFSIALHWSFWKSLTAKLRLTNERLAQFFSESGKATSLAPAPPRDPTGEFHVDLAAKRQLFQEQKLSSMEIHFLSSLSKEKKLSPGQVLFREGEPGDRMYVVLEGRVMISKYIQGAGEEALAFLERGDYFGEMALIENQPRSADAKAAEAGAVVLAIPREVLEGILDINRISSLRLLKILCSLVAKRLRELDDKIIGWYILAGGSGGGTHPPRS